MMDRELTQPPTMSWAQAMKEQFRRESAQRKAKRLTEIATENRLTMPQDEQLIEKIWQAEQATIPCASCVDRCLKKQADCLTFKVVGKEVVWVPCAMAKRLEEEQQRRLQKKFSALHLRTTWETFALTKDNQQAVKLSKAFMRQATGSLYLQGGYGTGKTQLATLIAKDWYLQGRSVEFGSVPKLLSRLKELMEKPGESVDALLGKYERCSLLVLDDIGTGMQTPWRLDVLFQMIDERYAACKPIILTSNYTLEDLKKRLGQCSVDMAGKICSRLSEMCTFAHTGFTDWRKLK